MLSRCLALILAPALPVIPFVLPFGPAHTIDAFIAGGLATMLALFALADDRARIGAAVVGGWVALAPFVFWSSLVEQVVCVSWGVSMFVLLAGPFSMAPRVTRVLAAAPMEPSASGDDHLPLAA
jgi:hypothetical protein